MIDSLQLSSHQLPIVHRLQDVAVRDVWPNEARDFTPWLAENPDVLAEALGMELELEGREVPVGPFSADIVFRETSTDHRIVVENWLESTNHDHVGKLLTYSAGLEASYAVLVATTFRPEHRTALTWLNSITKSGSGFFGIEVRAVTIADSPPAINLDVVVEPDDWAKDARETSTLELSEARQRYVRWGQSSSMFSIRPFPVGAAPRFRPRRTGSTFPPGERA